MHPCAASIWRTFQNSNKKHLFLTGSRGSGKTTLLRQLEQLILRDTAVADSLRVGADRPLPGITTVLKPRHRVLLTENRTGSCAVIGIYPGERSPQCDNSAAGNRMQPVSDGFYSLGIPALQRCRESDSTWVSVDELGYLESSCLSFLEAFHNLLAHKQVLAVLRSQNLPYLDALRAEEDAFVVDLDRPWLPVGCIIMASGLGKRFGSNKLLADFCGKPLIARILELTADVPFSRRLVVTRHEAVAALCRRESVDVLVHDLPRRSDTVRLGVEALQSEESFSASGSETAGHAADGTSVPLSGLLFLPADQPLVTRESLETLLLSFSRSPKGIYRLGYHGRAGSPVLFGSEYFEELKSLPAGCGGGFLAKKYPGQVHSIPVREEAELDDIDTPEDLKYLAECFTQRQTH